MHQKIKQTERPDLDKGRATLHALLELLERPDSLHEAAGNQARGVLNQAIFTRLYLNVDDEGPQLTEDEPTETFAPLINTYKDHKHNNGGAAHRATPPSLKEPVDEHRPAGGVGGEAPHIGARGSPPGEK